MIFPTEIPEKAKLSRRARIYRFNRHFLSFERGNSFQANEFLGIQARIPLLRQIRDTAVAPTLRHCLLPLNTEYRLPNTDQLLMRCGLAPK